MDGKILFFGFLVILATCSAKPSRMRRDILRDGNPLITKLLSVSKISAPLSPNEIRELMELRKDGDLTMDMIGLLADAILAPSDIATVVAAIKDKLKNSNAWTADEDPVAWAMSVTKGDYRLTDAEMRVYNSLRLQMQPKIEHTELADDDIEALVQMMKKGETLSQTNITNLMQNKDDLLPEELAMLAEKIVSGVAAGATDALKMQVMSGVRLETLSKEDRMLVWAMEQRKMLTRDDFPTREELKTKAETLLTNHGDANITATTTKLNDVAASLSDEELETVRAMIVANRLSADQMQKALKRIAENVVASGTKMSYIKDAILDGTLTEDDMVDVRALMAMNLLSDDLKETLSEEFGVTASGRRATDVFSEDDGDADAEAAATDLGFTTEQKASAKEMSRSLKGSADFDKIETPEQAKKVVDKYRKLAVTTRDKLKNVTARVDEVTETDIESMGPEIIDILDRDIVRDIASKSTDKKKAICRQVMKGEKELFLNMTDVCTTAVYADMDLDDVEKESLSDKILAKNMNPSTIDGDVLNELRNNGLLSTVIDRIDPEDILDSDDLMEEAIRKGDGDRIAERIRENMNGSLGSADAETVEKLMKLGGLKSSDVQDLSISTLISSVLDAAEMILEDPEMLGKIQERIKAEVTDTSSATPDKIAAMMAVGAKVDFSQVSDSAVTQVLSTIKDKVVPKKDKEDLAKRVVQKSEYSDPTAMSATRLTEVAPVLNELSNDYFDKLDDSQVKALIEEGTTKTLELGVSKARKLAKAAASTGTPTKEIMKKLPREAIAAIEPAVMANIPVETLVDPEVLAEVTEAAKYMSKASRQTIANTLKSKIRSEIPVCKVGKLCNALKVSEIEAWPEVVVDELAEGDSTCELDCDSARLDVLLKKCKSKYGEFDSGNYNTKLMGVVAKLVSVLSETDLEKLDTTMSSFTTVVKAAMNDPDVSEKKRGMLRKKVKDSLTDAPLKNREEILAAAPAFKDMDLTKLNTIIPKIYCADTVEELKNVDKTSITATIGQDHTRYSLECTGSTTGAIDDTVAKGLGNLVCFLDVARIADLTPEAVKSVAPTVQKCVDLDAAATKAFADKLKAQFTDLTAASSADVTQMLFVVPLTADELGQLPLQAKSDNLGYAVETQMEKEVSAMERQETVGGEREEITKLKEEGTRLAKSFIDADISVKAAAAASAGARKKRSTDPLTCSTVRTAGAQAKALTMTQLSTLTDASILECLTDLGAVPEWSAEQKAYLGGRLKAAGVHNSDMTQWTANQIQDSGNLLEGLSTTDLHNLPWTSNLLAVHGTRSSWTAEQLASIVGKWLEVVRADNAATITSDDLGVIGHFTCGLTKAHIDAIPAAVFQASVSDIGASEGCSTEQAAAFASKAHAHYGDYDTWTASTVMNVNNILAGLTGTEFSSLPTVALAEVKPTTIALLPPNTLSGLSDTQIRGLSTQQALKVSAEQARFFNPSQLSALEHAGGYKYVNSGAATNLVSFLSTIAVIMATTML